MVPELLYPGSLVYALDGRTYHHATIESQPFNDKQNNPVVRITWVTAPHYGHIEIPCDRVMELPTKQTRFPPFRFSSGNVAVNISHRVIQQKQSLHSRKRPQQKQPLHSRKRPLKGVVERGQACFRRTQEGKRRISPGSVVIIENPTRRKRSNKHKTVVPHCSNVISKIHPMRLLECYNSTKSNQSVRNSFNVPEKGSKKVELGENTPQCSVIFCKKKKLVRLSCRQSCKSMICIRCMKQMLSHTASEKMRCPTCRQQFSPRTFERIIANYKKKRNS